MNQDKKGGEIKIQKKKTERNKNLEIKVKGCG